MVDYVIYEGLVEKHLELSNRIIPKAPKDEYVIAIASTGHNASITVAKGDEILEVLELERFINLKNADFSVKVWKDIISSSYLEWSNESIKFYLNTIKNYLSKKYTNEFYLGIFVDRLKLPKFNIKLDEFFKVKNNNWYRESHHLSHGAGAFYQSDFYKALVFTIDGGSIDGNFTAAIYEKNKSIIWLDSTTTSLGRSYYKFGRLLEDIKYTEHGQSVTYPGKLMGLAGYGIPDVKLTQLLKTVYEPTNLTRYNYSEKQLQNLITLKNDYNINVKEFENPFTSERKSGEEAFTLAASAQAAFEEAAIDKLLPFIKQYPELPICISGGSGLNILFNTRLVKEFGRQLFVPPDPTDCGLSFGAMLNYLKPETPINNPYLGSELLDRDMLGTYLYEEIGINNPNYIITYTDNVKILSDLIVRGKIIGICQGRSERGPRALGNRSIICTVLKPDMKDIINAKVKHREWYRPFSPIVRLEDVSKFFEWEGESRFMTFSPLVREEYRNIIKPVVHADNTARVQTVTREQNTFIYDLLTSLDKKTGVGMILNTSFNVDGRPIVSSVKDAFKVLKETELDGIYIEGALIVKK